VAAAILAATRLADGPSWVPLVLIAASAAYLGWRSWRARRRWRKSSM